MLAVDVVVDSEFGIEKIVLVIYDITLVPVNTIYYGGVL